MDRTPVPMSWSCIPLKETSVVVLETSCDVVEQQYGGRPVFKCTIWLRKPKFLTYNCLTLKH